MPEQALAAFEKLQSLTRDRTTLSALRAEIEAAAQDGSASDEEVPAAEAVAEFTIDEPAGEPSAEFGMEEIPVDADESFAVVEQVSPEQHTSVADLPAPAPLHVEPAAPAQRPGVLQEFVSDLESSLGESFLPDTISHEAGPALEYASAGASKPEHRAQPELESVGNATPTTFGVPQTEPMGEFVADLEASLGDDFLKGAPVAEPEPAPTTQPATRIEAPVAATPVQRPVPTSAVTVPLAASAAAAAASSGTAALSSQAPALAPHQPATAGLKPHVSPVFPSATPAAAVKSSPFGEDAGVDLAEMFGELKHDLESGVTTADEDPETHYNLGIAFREMGLLDEAIGELQKTCQAVDRGHPFPQVMQTYTWLAQCFLDKGVPEAAIRWYDKALHLPGIDEETRTALHYELAAAYETAGDRRSALKHFMEVYGRNIDYRDVAERIKPLKS
jgi:hypothetical protein